MTRFRKSSSPSRWLMGLPPTSPRLKFTHTHPGGSPVQHRRPPRHPPSPSTRSRSLELLDPDEKKSVSPIREPEPQPRPRSRSLDGLLDEDGMLPETKTEESAKPKQDQASKTNSEPMETVNRLVVPEKAVCSEPETACKKIEGQVDGKTELASLENSSKENEDPTPVPRQRTRTAMEAKEAKRMLTREEPKNREENPPTRPPKPNRFISMDSHLLNTDEQGSRASSENVDPCAGNAELKERLVATGNDKSTLLKAKSCGAGLDSDESISSNEYKPKTKEQGSLLSLPTGAEPKRKKNFMDKCVNKVRSFMRK